ncbi:signal peptide peptidase SppA [Aquirufa antheringensis]|uniref:Signal peptide peptidase SppA n=1 Tax=Aquirufa antheringensis TaxID=2516559 RepID=A0A4Q9BE81_9BACT|nr:signal peptide peptidase SppA [Aquirufa antheringensis]MCZ2484488.1 signal peptide peptidase SppA [Aquirufa antheringensis]TBH74307.1 signal peptide peptidase SppA [Aquirufa antheringensis]USQ02906.1 signal peptide peptidase SppA [Aquirufa antheringensis]
MWQFVKYSLATVVGLFLFAIVSLLLLAGVGAAMDSSDEVYDLKDNSVLKLDLNRPIVENATTEDNPFAALTDLYFAPPENLGLIQVLSALERAKVDPKIKGIYLDASFPIAGYAQLSEIREAIQKFKKSGKFVYAYANSYTEKGYYVSSVADKTYLNPNGLLDFNGISVQYTFYKKALDKLEIEPLVFRVGTYKSAVEPFIREDMSEENKAQTSSFLQSINTYVFDKIARSKNIPVRKLDLIADSLQAFEPSNAEKLGMVKQGYWDEFEALLKKGSGEKEKVIYVSVNNYLKAKNPIDEVEGKDRIAVLVAEGEISGTRASEGNIGSDDFVKELKKLRESKSVKAIVLRIDSPGGSSLASDIMWREIELTKKVKPIISSMSNYAASGGYYMAMGTDVIVAQPTTITGSIGIFAAWFNVDNFLKNTLGITQDHVNTHANSNFMTSAGALTDFQKSVVQKSVDKGYLSFTTKAAAGRKMTLQRLQSVAGGRVWTGAQAKQIGLVDELGGLDKAIEIAASKAKLKPGAYKVSVYPKAKSFVDELLSSATSETSLSERLLAKNIPWASSMFEVNRWKKREGFLAMMPYLMEFE